MRKRLERKRVFVRGGIIAINAKVDVTVLRSYPGPVDQPASPAELAEWVSRVLRLKSYKGPGRRSPGIARLSRWVANRMAEQPQRAIRPTELLDKARQWLPEFFEGVRIDRHTLKVYPKVRTIEIAVETSPAWVSVKEDEALECLDDANSKRRVRGLSLLVEVGAADLFEWCLLCLDDESTDVRVAALRTVLACEEADVDADGLVPFSESEDRRIRAAAIAALAGHGGEDAPHWFRRGLEDPQTCVRVEAAAQLGRLDPSKHKEIFELALHDPNPDIERRARKLSAGKGYGRPAW